MQENGNDDSEFGLKITGIRVDGRRRYDRQSKAALARACMKPGVSLTGMALKHGVNANLLRKWVVNYRMAQDAAAPVAPAMPIDAAADAFVPVVLRDRAAMPIEKRGPRAMRPAIPTDGAGFPAPACLRARLPNGVTLEFDCSGRDAPLMSAMIETLRRCDVPPRG